MENRTYLDFSILDDDMLPHLNLEAKDDEEKGDNEKQTPGKVSKTLSEALELRRRVLIQVYGTRCPKSMFESFPLKLMKLLSQDDLQEYISWLPHGRAFLIHRPHAFLNDVVMANFKMTKFRSFTRQLNIWGFKRIDHGRDVGAYYHELFLRGRPKLALFMRRQQIKAIGTKLPSHPSKEPRFYELTAMKPLSHCEDHPTVSLKSSSLKTDDVLPKSAEESDVTKKSAAAAYSSQTGAVGTLSPVHGSPCPRPNALTEQQDELDPSPLSRTGLEAILLEQNRQQLVAHLQLTSQVSLRQAQQWFAQYKAAEEMLQRLNKAINASHVLPFQPNHLSASLQLNNFPQNLS